MNAQKINFWIRYLFPLFLAFFLGILIFMLAQFRESPGFSWHALLWFIGVIFMLWECGWWVSRILDKQVPWREGTFKRLSFQLLVTNLLGTLLFLGAYILLNWYETSIRGSFNELGLLHILVTIAHAFFIIQIINSAQIGYQLLQTWQEVQLETEAYKKEQVLSRLDGLRQQIDPTLLVKNFTILEGLIEEAPEQVGAYLKEMSTNYQSNQQALLNTLTTTQQILKEKNEKEDQKERVISTAKKVKTRFFIRSGTRFYLIPIEDIVAFYKDEVVLVFTKEGKKYAIDSSLEEVYKQLEPAYFFRINRQCIVHVQYLSEMRMDGNQMLIELKGAFPKKMLVSQRNVAPFKRWLNEK